MQTFFCYVLAFGFVDNITTKREYRFLSKFLNYIKFENRADENKIEGVLL